jgi:hypothetical protein
MKHLTIIISILLLSSCAAEIILPGLCYSDRTGTFICPEIENIKPPISPEPLPPTDIWKECKPFLGHPEPAWSNCILIA